MLQLFWRETYLTRFGQRSNNMPVALCEKSWPSTPGHGWKLQRLVINFEMKNVKEIWCEDTDGSKAPTTNVRTPTTAAMKAMKAMKTMKAMKAMKSMKSMKAMKSMSTAPMEAMNAMKTMKSRNMKDVNATPRTAMKTKKT